MIKNQYKKSLLKSITEHAQNLPSNVFIKSLIKDLKVMRVSLYMACVIKINLKKWHINV